MIGSVDNMRAVHRLSDNCDADGHRHCQNEATCGELARWAAAEVEAYQAAIQFEAPGESVEIPADGPNALTPTADLMACAASNILSVPWTESGLKRSIWATVALARLAERGIHADAFVRTHLADAIRRKIALHVAIAWAHSQRHGTQDGIPYQAAAWLNKFEEVVQFRGSALNLTFVDALVAASTGKFRTVVEEWIKSAAIAHIVAWRVDEALLVNVPVEALAIEGGPEAAQWVFDRFTKTYIHEWHNESVAWELSFALAPEQTARRSGVDIRWLVERPPSLALTANTLVRQHTLWTDEPDLILSGVSEAQLIEDILHLVYAGELRGAQELATEVCSRNPGSLALKRLRAFTLIPTDPGSARKLLLDDEHTSEKWLRLLNLASCSIVEKDFTRAEGHIRGLDLTELENETAWLWVPASLRDGPREVKRYRADQWVIAAQTYLDSAELPL